jgi:hypothetical protein
VAGNIRPKSKLMHQKIAKFHVAADDPLLDNPGNPNSELRFVAPESVSPTRVVVICAEAVK